MCSLDVRRRFRSKSPRGYSRRGVSLVLADGGRLSERLEKLAVPNGSADNGSRLAIDIPAFVRELSGPSTVVAHAVSDLDDGPGERDTMEGAISPDAFLRIASGISRVETEEKPLPPLPSDVSSVPLSPLFSFHILYSPAMASLGRR